MALRNIRIDGDSLLRKRSKKIKTIDTRLKILLDDMLETMYDAEGVGLAAPQVGILKSRSSRKRRRKSGRRISNPAWH